MAELEQVMEQVEAAAPPPLQPQPSPPLVPTVAATALVSPPPAAVPVLAVPVRFDPAVLAQVAALKAGPRVGSSPANIT